MNIQLTFLGVQTWREMMSWHQAPNISGTYSCIRWARAALVTWLCETEILEQCSLLQLQHVPALVSAFSIPPPWAELITNSPFQVSSFQRF